MPSLELAIIFVQVTNLPRSSLICQDLPTALDQGTFLKSEFESLYDLRERVLTCSILYYPILSYPILYYTVLYCTILYHTILGSTFGILPGGSPFAEPEQPRSQGVGRQLWPATPWFSAP